MPMYAKFRNSSLDTSPIGLYCGQSRSDRVYTPVGARVIAWSTEIEGLHFCQVAGFGSLVFAVDPSAPPGDFVHPVARDMSDFISLILACRSVTAVALAYRWSKAYFNQQIASVKLSAKARSVLKALENSYRCTPAYDPYNSIRTVQSTFDYASLPLHLDYFEWCPVRPGKPSWRVSYNTGFSDYCEKSAASREHSVTRHFRWGNENWCVPAVYLSDDSIVVDSYMEIPAQTLATHSAKWNHAPEDVLSIAQKITRDLEDPTKQSLQGILTVNNKSITARKAFQAVWYPQKENTWEVRRTLDHYGLDRETGYLFRRDCFLRKGQHNAIRTIEYTLSAEPVTVPGQSFLAPSAGKSIIFKHPDTQIPHTLTVISQLREALDPNFLSNHPCCYTRLHFTLTPPIHPSLFKVVDCDPGDPWTPTGEGPALPKLTDKTPAPGHCALSSLRYAPAEKIRWQMLFTRKMRQDIHVRLIP